jgi:predicted nucleic acid-binding protein
VRIFLDANILFSAAKSDGAVSRLLRLLQDAGHALFADEFVAEEARRNLAIKAPGRMDGLHGVLARLHVSGSHPLHVSVDRGLLPEKDLPVLAAAVRLGCDALVTGDARHFGALYGRTVHGVKVHSPRSLAAWLLK